VPAFLVCTVVSANNVDFLHSYARVPGESQWLLAWDSHSNSAVTATLAPVHSQCSLPEYIDDLANMELTSPKESLHHLTDVAQPGLQTHSNPLFTSTLQSASAH